MTIALSTTLVDELLYGVVMSQHLHAVVEASAGLDTRPFRLPLPNDLRWIELDHDAMLLYKSLRLAHLSPNCRVDRVAVDILDPAARGATLAHVCRGIVRGLLLTENALGRLSHDTLIDLGRRAPRGLKWWILPERLSLQKEPEDFIAQICGSRWAIADCRPLDREARRLAPARLALAPSAQRYQGSVWLLRRADSGRQKAVFSRGAGD
jgi:hypothetical protein